MSHFTVAVFHKSNESITDILEQYGEEAEVLFIPAKEEYADEYENGTVDGYRLVSGKVLPDLDKSLYIQITEREYLEAKNTHDFNDLFLEEKRGSSTIYKRFAPEYFDAYPCEISFKELYPTIDEFIDSLGYDFSIKDGEKGFWTNPNAKWDWYEIGGRWNGLLKLKPGATGTMGTDGVFGGYLKGKSQEGRCSSAKVSDIDFSPNQEQYEKLYRWWEVVIDGKPLKDKEKKEDFPPSFYKQSYMQKRYGSAENYAKDESSFSTYAVIQNGKWYEPGEMGWFGVSNSTIENEQEWSKNYHKFIENAAPDDVLTIVDCHI